MNRLKVYSTGRCPICDKTKTLLKKWNIPFDEARIDVDRELMAEFSKVTQGARTVPQITIDGIWIGSFSELIKRIVHMQLGKF